MKILLILIIIPFIEIFTFIKVGAYLGAMHTIWITILSAIIGLYLVRKESDKEELKALKRMQNGEAPIKESISKLLLMVAGILLIIPGLVTDAIGAILLIPFVRTWLFKQGIARFEQHINTTKNQKTSSFNVIINGKPFHHKQDKNVIDGIIEETNNDN